MIEGFVKFGKMESEAQLKELVELAKRDNHGVFIPTHPLSKDGKPVGYFSVGHPGAVICFAWLSTQDISARESFHLINSIECMVACSPQGMICFPVPKNSPFHPLMEKMGYTNGGEYTFFIKKV